MDTEPLADYEPQRPTIEVGEWFKPFVDYGDRPYHYLYKDYRSKNFSFEIEGFGGIEIDLDCSDKDTFEGDVRKGIVILPFGEQEIRKDEFQEYQKKFESRLLDVGICTDTDVLINQEVPHKLELQLPSGRLLFSKFGAPIEKDVAFSEFEWHDSDEDEGSFVFIPEIENILGKLQLRVVPDTGNSLS